MIDRLPPLNPLRAFEATARNGHVGKAAAELNLTQSAVSHQLRALETALELKLFERSGRGIKLTEAGEGYLIQVQQAFALLSSPAFGSRDRDIGGHLLIQCAPVFASRWLVPQLPDFKKDKPNAQVSLRPRRDPQGDSNDDADVWIQYGRDNWGPRWSKQLVSMHLFPVCSPEFFRRRQSLDTPTDLLNVPLLHEDEGREWERWLSAAGLNAKAARQNVYLHDLNLTATAAIDHQGVALIDNLIGTKDLNTGALQRLFDIEIPASGSYYIICRPERMRSPLVRQFVDWVISKFA